MTLTNNLVKFAVVTLAVLIAAVLLVLLTQNNKIAQGSTIQGQEYMATTTAANVLYGNTITGSQLLKSGYGSLGSVVITGANTGVFNFYDATTTNVSLRTGNKATSTILIASIPASMAAGTYTFDAQYGQGLYLDVLQGSMPTSTITFR